MHLSGSPDRWPRVVASDRISLADALDRLCVVAACRDALHRGTLWYPGWVSSEGLPKDRHLRTRFIAAILAWDCRRELHPDASTGAAIVDDGDWAQFYTWYEAILPWEAPSRRPLDLVIEALARGDILAIARPRGSGPEVLIPADFWERCPGEALMVLASCAIDSKRIYEPSVAFDSDLIIESAGFQEYLKGFAARMRAKRTLPWQEVVAIFERYREPYEAGEFGLHELISKVMRDHHLKDRDNIRQIAQALPWKKSIGRQPRRDDS